MLRRCVCLETSRIGAPYIYDISNLRVNTENKGQIFFETSFTNYPATDRNMWRSLEELNLQQHRYVNLNST